MAIDKIFDNASVDGIADNLFKSVSNSVSEVKAMQQRKAAENVQLVIQALKKIEGDLRQTNEEVANELATRIASIKDGKDGKDGTNAKDGRDGRPGRDGAKGDKGDRGLDGRNGVDGKDGISVTDAKIDFDGSLIISLSTGKEINVGEVVSSDLADKIQIISTMSTNGAVGIKDEGSSISTGVKNINFVGATVTATNSGDDVTVNVSAGTGTVTSVAASVPAFLSVAGSPITTTGTLAISLSGTALPVANGGTGITSLGTGVATFLGTPSSANLAAALTDETGTGSAVFATSPTLVTPALGTPSSGVVTNLTGTASININGTVGATTPASGSFTSLTDSGNLTFTGTGNRITGDFSNGTLTSRVAFQTSTANSSTNLHVLPNGTGTASGLKLEGDASMANGSRFTFDLVSGTDSRIGSGQYGTGTYLPMTFYTSGSERMRLDTSGNVGIGTTTTVGRLRTTLAADGLISLFNGTTYGLTITSSSSESGAKIEATDPTGTASFQPLILNGSIQQFKTGGTERMRIDSSGNVGIGTTAPGAKLDVTNNQAALSYLIDTSNTTNGGSSIWRMITRNIANTGTTSVEFYKPTGSGFSLLNNDTNASNFTSFNVGASERMRIDSSGIVTMAAYGAGAATFSAAGVISSVSDETWKIKDGVPVDPDAMLKKLEPGYWYYNDEKKETFGVDRQLGFYAQNVNAAIGPEAAPTPEEGKPWGYYDRSVLAVTVMSLQKALATIESLTARITALESKG